MSRFWCAGPGKIPGGVIALLGQSVTTFIKNNPTWETTPQLEKMLPRFDASRDWSGPDAVTLLDELAAVQATPINMALDKEFEGTIRTGTPLPPELASAPWGETHPSGIRLAYLLEPRAAEHPLNTPLKGRILIHNAGKQPVVFRAPTWHQAGHTARDAKGADINIVSLEYLTLSRLVPFRLAPGEFVEVNTAGIGVGANKNSEDWQNIRVGSWVDAKVGDEVTVTTTPVPLSDWNEEQPLDGEPRWWLDFITARLSRNLPLPADAEARKLLLYRAAMELFGTPVSEEANAAFVADTTPTALDSLAKRLAHRAGLTAYTGSLQSAPTKFRVLPADPDVAKRPRVACNPGWYTLGENIRLDVSRRPDGTRTVNEASILFFSPDPKADAPGKPVALKLPDGYNTWAAVWMRGGTVLWVQQKSGIRSYDFTNPAQVKETNLEEPANLEKVPKPILDVLRAAFDVPGAPKPATETPKPPAAPKPAATPQPKDKEAQALFNLWQDHARKNGNIPGGLIGRLGDKTKEFIRANTGDKSGDPYAKKMAPLVPRFDAARDWTPAEAVALLDDIAAVSDGFVRFTKDKIVERTIRTGAALPPNLVDAPWGGAQPNGLRLAWMLEPRAEEHRLGTALKSRIYIHNSGKAPVVLRTHTWHQSHGKARDAKGADINVSGITWFTIPPLVPFWLAPGEYIELTAPGIGLGTGTGMGEWADVRVSTIVEAKEGDIVTLTPGPVPTSGRNESEPYDLRQIHKGEPRWWLDFIAERLNRELPLPADAAERTRLLDRAVRELFGIAPTVEETAAFVADAAPNAMDSLAKRLAQRAGLTPFTGSLQSGATKFRVLAADPDAASRPRVAIGPGEYPLCHTATLNATLKIVGRPVGDRRVNDAEIRFLEPEEEVIPHPSPHKLEVPDGWGTWAIVCRPGTGVLWLMSKGAVRKIDYSNPAQVKETPIKPGSSEDMPGEFRDAVQRILTIYDIPAAEQEALLSKVAANAAPAPAATKKEAQR